MFGAIEVKNERSMRISRIKWVRNEDVRRIIKAHEALVDRIEKGELKWFEYVLRMDEHRWPRQAYK